MQYKYVALKPETADRLDKLADAKGMKKLDLIEAMVAAMESEDGAAVDVPDVPEDSIDLVEEIQQVKNSKWRTAVNIDAKTDAILNWLRALRGTTKIATIEDCVVAAYAFQQIKKFQAGVEAGQAKLRI